MPATLGVGRWPFTAPHSGPWMAGTPKPERLRLGGVGWGGSLAPRGLAGAGAAGLGTRVDPGQPTCLPLVSACRCPLSSSPSHVLPPGGVTLRVCSLDRAVPLAAGPPLTPCTLLPAPQQGQQDGRQSLHPAGLPPLPRLLTRASPGLWICRKWDKGPCRGLPRALGPPAPASNNGPHTGPQARHWARDGHFPP